MCIRWREAPEFLIFVEDDRGDVVILAAAAYQRRDRIKLLIDPQIRYTSLFKITLPCLDHTVGLDGKIHDVFRERGDHESFSLAYEVVASGSEVYTDAFVKACMTLRAMRICSSGAMSPA